MEKINLDGCVIVYYAIRDAHIVHTVNPAVTYEVDTVEYARFNEKYEQEEKSRIVMMVIWFFLGILGFHRFYIGDMKKGALLLFTVGGLIVGWLIDIVNIGPRVTEYNEELKKTLLEQAILRTRKKREAAVP